MDTRVLGSGANAIAKTAIFTHPGLDPTKQVNEDVAACVETPLGLLALVCDGMGGHEGGKAAAETSATEILRVLLAAKPGMNPKQALHDAITSANARVHASNGGKANPAGSTGVAILVHAQGTEVAHVGDSRAHLSHRGTIALLTRDHTKVRAMVDAGLLTLEQARVHPDASQITRAIGIHETVDVEMRESPVPHQTGDIFVLCTDGLSDLVTPEEMQDHTAHMDEARAAETLVGVALSRGGHDNTTVVIVHVLVDASVSSTRTAYLTPPPAPSAPSSGSHVLSSRGPAPPSPTIAAPLDPAPSSTRATAPPIVAIAPNPANSSHQTTTTISDAPPKKSRASLFIGLSLAMFAVAILVALYFVIESRSQHVSVPVTPLPGALSAP